MDIPFFVCRKKSVVKKKIIFFKLSKPDLFGIFYLFFYTKDTKGLHLSAFQ